MSFMFERISLFWDLISGLTTKELRTRYKYTLFGFIWIFANPLLQMIIIGFIFPYIIKNPIKNYYFFLFPGLLIWNFFSTSLNKSTPSIVYERSLIKKARFPHAVIPLSIIFSNLIHFLLAFMIFMIPVSFIGNLSLPGLASIFLAVLLLITFTVGLCLLTSALNVRYRDVAFFVSALLIVWFYASPIIYSLTMIPRQLLWLWRLNPLTSILQLIQTAFSGLPGPGPAMLLSNIAVIILVFAAGIYVFHKESKHFDDWL